MALNPDSITAAFAGAGVTDETAGATIGGLVQLVGIIGQSGMSMEQFGGVLSFAIMLTQRQQLQSKQDKLRNDRAANDQQTESDINKLQDQINAINDELAGKA